MEGVGEMVQVFQANAVTLAELGDRFGLEATEDAQVFPEWQHKLPALSPAEEHRLDRVKSSFLHLLEHPPLLENAVKMVVLSPLLEMADMYQKPSRIETEPSFQIVTEDEGTVIRGNVDVLVLQGQLWVMVIETKRAAIDVDEGRSQLLSYMLASPTTNHPTFGLITNGRNFLFIKLQRSPQPRYALSRLFSLINPGNELYTVLQVLKRLKAAIS